jgi:NitT/TauT family transport system ATP-binding protein
VTALLSCHDLSMEYVNARSGERIRALGPVDIEIADGEFVALVGPSGCGKSTLLGIVAGLVRPSGGEVRLDGAAVTGPGPERGVCFQDYALFPWMSVLDNVAFGLKAAGVSRPEREQRARGLIDRVKLTGFEARYPHELSGGMRQRCALARVLANDPRILLMDEPMAALDAQTRQIMQDDLLRVWSEGARRKTIVYVTHSIDEAVYLADRILVMSARPGLIKADLRNDFERPRSAVRARPEYIARIEEIWGLIRSDALQAISSKER